jgi:hypothetical protein
MYLTALEEAEIIPGKHSDTRIKPLPSTNGQRPRPLHDRYTRTDTCVRWGMFGGFRIETAIWIQKWFKNPLGLLEGSRYNSFSRRRRRAWLWL